MDESKLHRETERFLLGAALHDPEQFGNLVDPKYFDVRGNREIARVIQRLPQEGVKPDLITVTAALRDEFKENAGLGINDFGLGVGDVNQYVAALMMECPTAANAPEWLEVLKKRLHKRTVKAILRETWEKEQSGDDILPFLREAVEALASDEAGSKGGAQAVPIANLERTLGGGPDELLRDRYLCRGGALLLVGPTGVGKSSFSMQAIACWSVGRDVFGIRPARPIKSLLIQAENDEGDIAELRDGVLRGLGFSNHERDLFASNAITARETAKSGMSFCSGPLRTLLDAHRPDMVWIDPALSYIGGDANTQTAVGAFLRNGIAPLLIKFNCAAVLVHHTNKPPTGKEKREWSGNELSYLGSGSAEWANWPRAVLAIRSLGSSEEFELVAQKRGGRLGWFAADGSRTRSKFIRHAQDGSISWEEFSVLPESSPSRGGRPVKAGTEDILGLLPPGGLKTKEWQIKAAEEAGISKSKFFTIKKQLEQDERVHYSPTLDAWQPVLKRKSQGGQSPETSPKAISGFSPKTPETSPETLFGPVQKLQPLRSRAGFVDSNAEKTETGHMDALYA